MNRQTRGKTRSEPDPNCPSGCYSIHVTGMRLEDITCACGHGYYDLDTGEFISGDLVRAGYPKPKPSREVAVPKKCFKEPFKSKSLNTLSGHGKYPYKESADSRNRAEPLTRIAPSCGSPQDDKFIARQRTEPKRDFFVPGEGINSSVICRDIHNYLGIEAAVRPSLHPVRTEYTILKRFAS
jgi:hypothetical protein